MSGRWRVVRVRGACDDDGRSTSATPEEFPMTTIAWSTDRDAAVAAARSSKRPLLIDVEKHH